MPHYKRIERSAKVKSDHERVVAGCGGAPYLAEPDYLSLPKLKAQRYGLLGTVNQHQEDHWDERIRFRGEEKEQEGREAGVERLVYVWCRGISGNLLGLHIKKRPSKHAWESFLPSEEQPLSIQIAQQFKSCSRQVLQ